MRRYLRLVCGWALAIALLTISAPWLWSTLQIQWARLFSGVPLTMADTLDNSLVYTVKRGQSLTFALTEESALLRIISNAHIAATSSPALDTDWRYGIRYQFLQADGEVLREGVYWQLSRLPVAKTEQGEPDYGEFYLHDKQIMPLADRSAIFAWHDLKKAVLLRLSFDTGPKIDEIAFRAYVPNKISGARLATEWLRMSEQQQDELAQGSVYPATLLSEYEKQNLLKHHWRPLGPQGIDGKDYVSGTLYTRKNFNPQDDGPEMTAAGLPADPRHPGVLAIPETGGNLAISLKTADGKLPDMPVELTLKFYGKQPETRLQWQRTWHQETAADFPIGGGLLEIIPSRAVIITASLKNQQALTDITPRPLLVKTYAVQQGIEYPVLHFQQQPAAMRIDIRRIFPPQAGETAAVVEYQWLDQDSRLIQQGLLSAPDQASIYDRLEQDGIGQVSDPRSYYWHVPAQVKQVRLHASSPYLLANAYNQPANFIKAQKIPEGDYWALDRQNWQPAWFPLAAANEQTLLEKQQLQWVAGQLRPPEVDDNVRQGVYAWQDFLPQDATQAQTILLEDDGTQLRDDRLPSLYCQLPVASEIGADIKNPAALHTVAPELIFLRGSRNPFQFSLTVDGQPRLAGPAMGRQGVIRLPELTTGRHRFQLASDGAGLWLMNYLTTCNGKRYLKRRVFRLSGSGLTFVVHHRADVDELVSGRFFVNAGIQARSQLDVSLDPINPQTGDRQTSAEAWTFTRRSYDIRPPQDQPAPVLYSDGRQLNRGENFFIALNRDLPQGSYRIRIALKQGTEGFVSLTQIDPGRHEQHRLYRELSFENH